MRTSGLDALYHKLPKFLRQAPSVDVWLCLGLALLAYLPVMAHVSLRPTGDEKTYIAQAHEMAAAGAWFHQTLAGTPDYFKGPLFLGLLRLGFLLFGETSPWAISYMNFIGLVAAAVALHHLCRRWLRDRGAALIAAGSMVFATGVYAHVLAGQMEALLIVSYAVAAALVGCAADGPQGTWRRAGAWVVIGAAGWLKSPLHAALLGTSAILFWALTGELLSLIKRPREWAALLAGIAVGVAGYLPAFLTDYDAFMASYVLRETFERSGNGVGIWDGVRPLLFEHFLPWTPLLLAGLAAPVRRRTAGERRLLKLAWAWIVPTVAFFLVHPFRNGVYIMPVLPALSVLVAIAWRRSFRTRAMALRRAAFVFVAVLFAVVTAAFMALTLRFHPFPAWWGAATSPLALGGLTAAVCGFAAAAGKRRTSTGAAFAAIGGMALFFVGAGQIFIAVGAREQVDPAAFAAELAAAPPVGPAAAGPWYRLDLTRHLWSEWGLFNATLGRPVAGVHTEAALAPLIAPGQVFLAPDEAQLATLTRLVAAHPDLELRLRPWRRWLIHGELPSGEMTWHAAWRERSFAYLERLETIAQVVPRAAVATRH